MGGGFSLDSEQREAALEFAKSVETTTVTVGSAPPSNGDAMTWASAVKENPVPIKYSLRPIADLFTPRFMSGISTVNAATSDRIRRRLRDAPQKSCESLQSRGKPVSCAAGRNWETSQVVNIVGGYPWLASGETSFVNSFYLGTQTDWEFLVFTLLSVVENGDP